VSKPGDRKGRRVSTFVRGYGEELWLASIDAAPG
jgi:hypothetical protein